MVARYGKPGGVVTCYLELALYKQALALQGKGVLDYENHWQIRQNCRCGAGWRCLKMRFLVFLVDPPSHFSGLSPSCTCFDFCLTCSSGHPGPCVWILGQCHTVLMIKLSLTFLPFYLMPLQDQV